MNKLAYLKKALLSQSVLKHDWVFSAFTLSITEKPAEPYDWFIHRSEMGYEVFDGDTRQWVRLEGADPKQPLFGITEKVDVDPSWAINLQYSGPISITNLVGNRYLFTEAFGSRIPCPTGKFKISSFESNSVAPKLASIPKAGEQRDPSKIYVDEYLKFCDGVQSLKCFAVIFTYSATKKNLTAPKGMKEFRKALNKEYEGRLDDPLVLAEYEAKLKAFDKEWLKDDPSYGGFAAPGRYMDVTRKKLYGSFGADPLRFRDDVPNTVVPTSLSDGWPKDPKQFASMLNSLRIGSYSRGAETVKGGVSAKILIRAGNNYKLVEQDCGSKFGVTRYYDETLVNSLAGVYPVGSNEPIKKEEVGQYLGKVLTTRSPFTCKSHIEGESICRKCAGELLWPYQKGMIIPLTEISSILLYASMKAMHGKVLMTAEIDLERHFS